MDSTGVLTAEFMGTARVVAVARIEGKRSTIGEATVKVLPQPASRIDLAAAPARVVVGSHLTLSGTPYSTQGDRRYDAIAFSSANPKVATVTEDGRLTAVAPGKATITAKAGSASATYTAQVVPNTIARLSLEPAATTVPRRRRTVPRQGDRRAGKPVQDVGVRWSVVGGSGVAQVDESGAFVAEVAGKYTVAGDVGGKSAEAIITVGPRNAGRGFEVLGRVPITERAAEVWVHQNGKCAYMSTIADRVYAIDVSDGRAPKIVDSMTNARIVNDVDHWMASTGSSRRASTKNGIVIFDARRLPSEADRRIHRDGLGRRALVLRLQELRVPHRRRHRLDARDRHPRSLQAARGGAVADRAGPAGPLPARRDGDRRAGLSQLLG
jgi:hypothetical protein